MPTMSNRYFAYLAPVLESEKEFWTHLNALPTRIAEFQDQCAHFGLTRRTHYSVKLFSNTEIRDILDQEDHSFPCRVPLCEINFRSRKHFEQFKSSGLAEEAEEPF